MTREEFARRIRGHVDCSASQESIEFAVARVEHLTEKSVDGCVGLANYLEQYWNSRHAELAAEAEETSDGSEPVAFTSMLTIDDLLQKLQPWVKSVRERLFHRTDAPFSSMNDAAAWIERTAKEPWHATTEEKARVYRLASDIREKLNLWRALTGLDWRDDGSTRFFFYRKSEEEGLMVVPLLDPDPEEEHPAVHSPLVELQHDVEHMYDVTGFYKDGLVTYLLTDIPPAFPTLKTMTSDRWHDLTGILRRQVTMEFLTGDTRKEELLQAYREIRHTFNTTHTERLSPEDVKFLALVKQHGPIPRGRGSGAKDYWESIRQEWNKVACKPLASWKAAEKKYDRLMNSFIDRPKRRAKGVKR